MMALTVCASFTTFAVILSGLAFANASWAQTNDASKFRSPVARCARETPGMIITSVGTFRSGASVYEIVSDTKLEKSLDGDMTEFSSPSVTAFNSDCTVVWHQTFPSFSEVGFQVLDVSGGPFLHIVAKTIFEPVDQVISIEELLVSVNGDSLVDIGPIPLGGDRYDSTYVGPIGGTSAFGVVVTSIKPSSVLSSDRLAVPQTQSLLYRWQPVGGLTGQWWGFVGPDVLDAKGLAALGLSSRANQPTFPLCSFVFGKDNC